MIDRRDTPTVPVSTAAVESHPSDSPLLRFSGRILFLSASPASIDAQLAGENLSLREAQPLRDNVSTDEITPVPAMTIWDDRLGRVPYTGFKAGDRLPIGRDAVRNAGIEVVVAGARYGKGSSREHSPAAERAAGVRLVIAESFERIYRQNADNIGLYTSTDFTLIDRIRRGEPISLDELLSGRDALTAAIVRAGGLIEFGQRHLREPATLSGLGMPGGAQRPKTLFEKIVERHLLQTPVSAHAVEPGAGLFVRADWRFIIEYYAGMAIHMLERRFGQALTLVDPERIVMFEDHTSYATESPAHVQLGLLPQVRAMCEVQRDFAARHRLKFFRTLSEEEVLADDGSHVAGISHAVMSEQFALPGQLIAGTDSHTPHSGALGCVAIGVGTTDMANALVTGALRFTMPETIRVELTGRLRDGVTAKDAVLQLLAQPPIRAGAALGKVFEFCGEAVRAMNIDERATLTNMVAELGGLTGLVEPDGETVRYLRERRGIEFVLEDWMRSDPDARVSDHIQIDCGTLSPMLARPGDPGQGVAVDTLPSPVPIDIAYGGSCTGGKRADFDLYFQVLSWALARGLSVAPRVQLYLQFGTTAVRDYCVARGYMPVFERSGARLLQPSCGACANCGPGSSVRPDQVTVSAINRNFPGRSGPGQVWLASPPTVMASAIAGELLSFDSLRARHGDQ